MNRREFVALSTAAVAATSCLGSVVLANSALANSADPDTPPVEHPAMDYPIVDTHVHFWDPTNLRYAWLDGSNLLNRPYLPEDYARATGGVEVGQIVFVQAECSHEQAVAEAQWVADLARRDARIQASVAWAPIELGEAARPTLDALAEIGNVRGIRRLLQTERDPLFCLAEDFVKGIRLLVEYDMTFDLGVNRTQLEAVALLAARTPEVRFIVDHIGVPDIRGGQTEPWRTHIKALAELPNVFCKISGVATAADHAAWTPQQLRPYIETVIESFGFDRCAFGSDWPVMLMAVQFPRWVEIARSVVQDCSADERRKLFVDVARSFYRLHTA